MVKVMKVPPDGGYGYVIIFASALANMISIPIIQNFGMIFKGTFAELGFTATEGALIINMNGAFGMLTGLINGVLLKIFGYRKIAIISSVFITSGIILTAYATSFTSFMITYGLITSFGFGLSTSSFSLALNTYFIKNRNRATGYAMTLTGLGPIIMPQLLNLLLQNYSVQHVTLILGGLVGNMFVCSVLLQPIKYHMKTELINEDDETDKKLLEISQIDDNNDDDDSVLSIDHDQMTPAIYGIDVTGSVLSLNKIALSRTSSLISHKNHHKSKGETKNLWKRIFLKTAKIFDLDLLRDPIYNNIMLGLSLAIFAEMNFSVLTAFILGDFGLSTGQIATFLSVLGIADIGFRFLAPYIGEYLNKPPRPMYLLSLFMLIITRFSLLLSNDYKILLFIAALLGIAKGVRTVYMSLVIPTYVPLEKLPSASGIQMMVNGVCLLVGGSVLGIVRDKTGSYTACIFIMNSVTFLTIFMWTIESIIVKYRKK